MRVVFTKVAQRHVDAIGAWWRRERLAAPDLFADELGAACAHLARVPSIGQPFDAPRPRGVRRLLLDRTRYHVYYTVDESRGLVVVRAVWHAVRGHGPSLR